MVLSRIINFSTSFIEGFDRFCEVASVLTNGFQPMVLSPTIDMSTCFDTFSN